MTPEVFSWDDASDNRFLASGVASWIHDAISAFHSTRIHQSRGLRADLRGAGGRGAGRLGGIVGDAQRVGDLEVLEEHPGRQGVHPVHLRQPERRRWMAEPRLQHAVPERPVQEADAGTSGSDAKLAALQDQEKLTAFLGFPGPMTPPAQEVVTTFIIPDMFTKVARGASIDDTMKWGVGEIRRIYAKAQGALERMTQVSLGGPPPPGSLRCQPARARGGAWWRTPHRPPLPLRIRAAGARRAVRGVAGRSAVPLLALSGDERRLASAPRWRGSSAWRTFASALENAVFYTAVRNTPGVHRSAPASSRGCWAPRSPFFSCSRSRAARSSAR